MKESNPNGHQMPEGTAHGVWWGDAGPLSMLSPHDSMAAFFLCGFIGHPATL